MDEVLIIYLLLLCVHALVLSQIVVSYFWRKNVMSALENLNANIAKLKTDVEALIAAHNNNSETQIQAAADAVAAVDAEVVQNTPQ